MPVKVVLADDNLFVREGLTQLLAGEPGVEIVAMAADRGALVAAVREHAPDVVVTDIRMPPAYKEEGLEVAALLRESHPGVGVVVLSNYADPAYALALLASGSEGRAFLLKERVHDRAQLLSAIHSVAAGGSVMDPKIIEPLMSGSGGAARSVLAELTPRELEVLELVAQGKSNAAVADALVLTKRAVEKHINSIFLKLGLSSEEDVSKRVTATLMYLAGTEAAAWQSDTRLAPRG
jgi:DNA-binding NarL/FixJ family response regulator